MLVSIIIPVYNGAAFIRDALESVKAQTHRELECIVIDDGSSDSTGTVVREWIKTDPRFSYFYQPNKGLSAARNTGLDNSHGNVIQFLDADDVILPTKLEEQLVGWSAVDLCVSYTDFSTGKSTDIFSPSDYYLPTRLQSRDRLVELIVRWETSLTIPPHSFLFSAAFFQEKKIRFDTSLPNHEDFDCWVTIFRQGPSITFIDRKLCIYRITDGSMSKKMRLMGEGFLQVLDKHLGQEGQSPSIRKALVRKRRETLKRYNRFDKMTVKDKLFLIPHLLSYYRNRICSLLSGKPQ